MLNENKKTARIAGIWYLANIVILMFSYMFVDAKLLVSGDAALSLSNINANKPLFYLGCAAFLIGYVCITMSALTLMKLFKPVCPKQAALIPILLIIGVIIVFIGKAIELYAAVTQNAGLLAVRENIDMSAEIFWGLWLLPIGMLIFRSKLMPKIVGILLFVACLSHVVAFAVFFFAHDFFANAETVIYALGMGEFVLVAWLLIKGVKVQEQKVF